MILKDKPAVLGQFVKTHTATLNRNSFIHALYSPARFAFPQQAVITQLKKIPDVSYYQGMIDWDKFRVQTDAVIIRAGQGLWGTDSQFLRNWGEAKNREMLRGVYWFFDDRETPTTQAAKLVKLLDIDRPELDVWIDWETYYGGIYGGLGQVVALMQEVERLAPWARVGLYSGYYWFIQNSNAISNKVQYEYLKTRPLWLAWYTSNAAIVKVPAPWSDLLYWQFGTPSVGLDYGVRTSEIDMSFYNGSLAYFKARYGGVVVPPPTGGTMLYGKVNTGVLNVRTGAGAAYADIGDLQQNDYIVATETVGGWWKLKEAYRGGWTGAPVALASGTLINNATVQMWCKDSYIVAVPAPVVTPPPPPPPVRTVTDIAIALAAGSVVTRTYSDGSQEVETA